MEVMTENGKDKPHRQKVNFMSGNDKKVLTVPEVAELLDANPRTVREWCRTGKLKAMRAGKRGKFMIRREDLESLNWRPEPHS